MRYSILAVRVVLVSSLALPAFAGGKDEVVDFTADPEATTAEMVEPQQAIDFRPMLPERYRRRREPPPPVMDKLADPLPLEPQKHGCGACSAAGAPGAEAGLVALLLFVVLGRRRRRGYAGTSA